MKREDVLKYRSRHLRREATPAEKILWGQLRNRRFAAFKFRRQHIWELYILDFYCPAARLVVELDGESHVGKEVLDKMRQQRIESSGLRVLRFLNPDVYERLDTVLEVIWRECTARISDATLKRDPRPRRGRGPT